MAEIRKLNEMSGHGALAEGAERLERMVRALKDQQLSRTRGEPPEPGATSFVLSPDEAWARKYMTQCIGPVCFGPEMMADGLAFPVAPPLTAPPVAQGFAPESQAPSAPEAPSGVVPQPKGEPVASPIGAAIGKPARRSRLARLFRGR